MSSSDGFNIVELLQTCHSEFYYDPNVSKKEYDRNIKQLDKFKIQHLYDSDTKNSFNDSDLKIAKLIAERVFATMYQIRMGLRIYNERKGNFDLVPIMEDDSGLKDTLKRLVNANIITRYKYDFIKKVNGKKDMLSSQYYYVVTPHGYQYLRRVLSYEKKYDDYIGVTPIDEVFKYLAAGNISNELLSSLNCEEIECDKRVYSKIQEKMMPIFLQAKVKVEDKLYHVIGEPMRFKFNDNRVSQADWDNQILSRLKFLKEYYRNTSSDTRVFTILICEDFDGVKKVGSLLARHLPEYANYMHITTDAVVYKAGLRQATLKLVRNDESSAGFGLDTATLEFI